MKIKTLLTGIFAIFTMSLLLAGTAMAATFGGHLDGNAGETVSGWAWDASNPDTPVDVVITVTNVSDHSELAEMTVTADQYREDLEDELNEYGKIQT